MSKSKHPILIDKFGRTHDYLRISLIERCNLRCTYCMPEEGIVLRDKSHFMTSEEIIAIASKFVELGVRKIRLTGGEPLVRRGVGELMKKLGELGVELTMTTNGILIADHVETMRNAGIKKLNVSLDTLCEDRFEKITRRKGLNQVLSNIKLLCGEGFEVRINVVLMKGINEDEILSFLEWGVKTDVQIRFIEFMPFDGNNWDTSKKVSLGEIIETISSKFDDIITLDLKGNETARRFYVPEIDYEFGVISTVTNPFCDTCNRIRLTADGKIKNCLFSNGEVDILKAFRNGENIEPLIIQALNSKQKSMGGLTSFSNELAHHKNRAMVAIGG